jgi:hypothetical protein
VYSWNFYTKLNWRLLPVKQSKRNKRHPDWKGIILFIDYIFIYIGKKSMQSTKR